MNSLRFTQTIEVIVGENKTSFFVHPRIIAPKSPFFDAALKRWKTAGEPITLSDDEPDVFDGYLKLLYVGNFTTRWDEAEDHAVELRFLFKLCILADKLGDLASADLVIDRITRYLYACVPDVEDILPAWRSTVPESRLRRLLVDAFVLNLKPWALSEQLEKEDIPQDFAVAVAQKLAAVVKYHAGDGENGEAPHRAFFAMRHKCN